MREFLTSSSYFGLVATIFAFELGLWVRRKTGHSAVNPMLIAIALLIVLLLGLDIEPASYSAAGASHLSYLLTPCTVALAIPLYRQMEALKNNLWAILGGILSGVATCMVCIPVMALLMNLSHEQYVSLLSKSITTAIGISMTEEMGGFVAITIVAIYFTGTLGNIFADALCRLFRLTEPVARGIAIGTASHAMGTARALEIGEVEGAMSGLSIAITGLVTAVVAPLFANIV